MKIEKSNLLHLATLLLVMIILSSADTTLTFGNNFSEKTDHHSVPELFIHTNKNHYFAKESIWFKGYLINPKTNMPDSSLYNVYGELWSLDQKKIANIHCLGENGSYSGNFYLPDNIPDGNYILIFFTDHFKGVNNKGLFSKYIYISNPSFANVISNQERRFNRDFNKDLTELHKLALIQVMPEGRSMATGIETKFGVVMMDRTGKGIETSGTIKDQNGSLISNFNTNKDGRAVFSYTPKSDNNTFLVETDTHGKQTVIPDILHPTQASLNAKITGSDEISVDIKIPKEVNNSQEFILTAENKNGEFYRKSFAVEDGLTTKIQITEIETGLIKISLLTIDNQKIAERLKFISKDDQAVFDIRARAFRQSDTDGIIIELQSLDQKGNPISGNFSVSVNTHNSQDRLHENNVFTEVFLSNHIDEIIPEVSQYFDYESDNANENLDLLLMTSIVSDQNWNLANFTSDLMVKPGITLSGNLFDPVTNQRLQNFDLTMKVFSPEEPVFKTRTDEQGAFHVEELMIFDSTLVEITAQQIAGRISPSISLQQQTPSFEEFVDNDIFKPNPFTIPQSIIKRGSNWKRPSRIASGPMGASPYGSPDQTIIPDPNINYNNIIEILRDKAVGLDISPSGQISLRGPTSIGNSNIPLFIIDGVESQGAFFGVNAKDVERIEIFKGASAVAFGARGANGALVAYTKRREIETETIDPNIFTVKGFHVPKVFDEISLLNDIVDDQHPKTITVYWDDNPQQDQNGIISFKFPQIKGEGRYRIVIQGFTKNGETAYGEFIIGQ